MSRKWNVLFVCIGNSCRSQMAEGWARHLHGDRLNPFSAGIEPRRVDPLAVEVMSEAGVDIAGQETHYVRDFLAEDIDFVITVCHEAAELCPVFPGKTRTIRLPFDDPPSLARAVERQKEKRLVYRRVRDEIRDFVDNLPQVLERANSIAAP